MNDAIGHADLPAPSTAGRWVMIDGVAARTPAVGRRMVASLWLAAVAPYVVLALWVPFARSLGFFASVPVPAVVALSVVAGALVAARFPRLAAVLPESLDRWFTPRDRVISWVWAGGGLFALLCFSRIAVFLGDPSRIAWSILPSDSFVVHHSCLTAYMHGAILSTDPSANVYDMAFVDSTADAPLPPTAAHFAPFKLDAYGYPPPFLLVTRGLLWLTADFTSQRVLFGAASLVLAFVACASAAKTLGGEAGRRLWLLSPLFLATAPVLATVQVGNFHLAAVAICLLCWVALEQRRDGLAGGFLAVATVVKVFPGLLGVLLLMQRRWRAAGFTVLAAAVFSVTSLAVLGPHVWRDYLFYQLPRVQSGEALRFMADSTQNIDFNQAPFGLPFKLAALGFSGWGWDQARLFGNLSTPIFLLLAVLAARNNGGADHRLTVWLGIVMLGSLRSPFAPPFVLTGVTFLLLALAAGARSRGPWVAIPGAWLVWLIPVPLPPGVEMVASVARALLLYVFLIWVVVRREQSPRQSCVTVNASIAS